MVLSRSTKLYQPGHRSDIYAYLPASQNIEKNLSSLTNAQPSSTSMIAVAPHVLIVDDNPGDIELIRIAFEMAGIDASLDTCHDGVDAIRCLELGMQTGNLPALLLLDLNMPRVNGFEVLTFMRDHLLLQQVPVVVMTTSSRAEDRQRCLTLGAREMFTKPENIHELHQIISRLRRYLPTSELNNLADG